MKLILQRKLCLKVFIYWKLKFSLYDSGKVIDQAAENYIFYCLLEKHYNKYFLKKIFILSVKNSYTSGRV